MKAKKSKRDRAFYPVAGVSQKSIKRQKTVVAGSFITTNYREAVQRLVKLLSREMPCGALLEVVVPEGMAVYNAQAAKDEDGFNFAMKRRHLEVIGRRTPTREDLRLAATEVKMLGEDLGGIINMQTGEVVPKPELDFDPVMPPKKLKFSEVAENYAEEDARLTAKVYKQFAALPSIHHNAVKYKSGGHYARRSR